MKKYINNPLINNRIRTKEVRLIGSNGKQIGVVKTEEAVRMAKEQNSDLIQVTDKTEPPVCKIMDYGKYVYQQKKKERAAKHHQAGELKGIRLSFGISDHDLEIAAKKAEKFLGKGDKVRIEMRLKGREKALQGYAREKFQKFLQVLKESIPIKTEKEIKKSPRGLNMIIIKDKTQKNENKEITEKEI